jgi:hypothetical protein
MAEPSRDDNAPVFARPRLEPASLTLADLIAIVAGVAISLPTWPPFTISPILPVSFPYWFAIGIGLYFCCLTLLVGASLAVLAREALYHRPARSAEWLGILIALQQLPLPNLD